MAFAPKFLCGLFLLAFATFSVASEDCTGTTSDGVCSEPHDDDVALMALRGPQRRAPGQASLIAEEEARKGVACPFKNVDTGKFDNCDGAQCCPQATETDKKTYPCPNAPANFSSCQLPKLVTGGSVSCTFSATKCWGKQCCPGADKTSNLTYPCPTNPGFAGCQTKFPEDSSVCPFAAQSDGSTAACSKNQCCLGAKESNGLTYPCPSNTNFGGCQTSFPTVVPLLLQKETRKGVACPFKNVDTGKFDNCDGAQCCPQATETDKKTYPCPNAPANFSSCQLPKLVTGGSVSCTFSATKCWGKQCCPGADKTGNLTYPCPTNPGFAGCQTKFPEDSSVCPFAAQSDGSTAACSKNQCCLGAKESNGLTYPCPSNTNFGGCQTSFPTVVPLLLQKEAEAARGVACLYAVAGTRAVAQCDGAQCCPRALETGNKTYPCPNHPGFDKCESPYPVSLSVPCTYPNVKTGVTDRCVANQCCPRAAATGNRTYPCPSSPKYRRCESSR